MSRLLDMLYHGTLQPADHMRPRDPDYDAVSDELSEKQRDWEKRLSEEERKDWDALEDLRIRTESMERREAFASGFYLGARLTAEGLADWPRWEGKCPFLP